MSTSICSLKEACGVAGFPALVRVSEIKFAQLFAISSPFGQYRGAFKGWPTLEGRATIPLRKGVSQTGVPNSACEGSFGTNPNRLVVGLRDGTPSSDKVPLPISLTGNFGGLRCYNLVLAELGKK